MQARNKKFSKRDHLETRKKKIKNKGTAWHDQVGPEEIQIVDGSLRRKN